MNKTPRILIVDDEEDICEILQFNLEPEGFEVEVAYSAEDALNKDLKSFDLLLLDVMMDQMSGYKLAEKIRKSMKLTIPIIFITAKTTENDIITGFSLGGDDYITKPFSLKIVIARVKAILNREKSINNPTQKAIIKEDDFELNISKRSLKLNDKIITLTKKEFEILTLLIKNPGTIYSRNEILNNVWKNESIVFDRTVDVHVSRLRKSLGKYGKQIKNKVGYGYLFEKVL